MIRVEECARSTLYFHPDEAMLVRRYHDTDRWSAPFPPMFDDRGHARCSGNRRIDLLVADREREFRGAHRDRSTPPYLQNALRVLCKHQTPHIEAFARELEVKTTTAWSYAYKVVEQWPMAWEEAAKLVHPEIVNAVRKCSDRSGSLRELYNCIHSQLHEAREVTDVFAHVRLARACIEAEKKTAPAS